MIGAGGVIPPVDGYWPEVERICRERGVLLVADEVISGFGRLGRWFGCERYGFTPDLMTCAKGISSGYVPLSAVVVSGRVREPFWREDAAPFIHGGTYAAHPGACVAARVNLDILERERLVERVAVLEPVLAQALEPLRGVPGVADVRTAGLAGGVELDPDLLAAHPTAGAAIVVAARRRGVLTRLLRGVALQISPPFVVTEEELGAIAAAIARRDPHPGHRRRRPLPRALGARGDRRLGEESRPQRRSEVGVVDHHADPPVHRTAALHDAAPGRQPDRTARAALAPTGARPSERHVHRVVDERPQHRADAAAGMR
jgi:hypothetical protein